MSAREKAIAAADRVLLAAEVGAPEQVPADIAEAIIDAVEPILTAELRERLAVAEEVIRDCRIAANRALSGWSRDSADALFAASAGATAWLASRARKVTS